MAPVDLRTATVEAAIDILATPIQAAIDLVALAIETVRQAVTAGSIGAIRFSVEATIDPVALPVQSFLDTVAAVVQAVLDAVTAVVEAILDAVAGISKCRATNDEQCRADRDSFPGIHVRSPLYPYKKGAFRKYNGSSADRLTGIMSIAPDQGCNWKASRTFPGICPNMP